MFHRHHVLRNADGEGGGGAPAPAPSPAAPAPPPAAPAPAPAAPAPSAAPGPAPAPAPVEPKGAWPENWRETVSKADAKRLTQLQRYGSPEAAIEALFSAQDRIRSGELKPVLGKTPSADELKEWREAHGIPAAPDKYDLGKDVKIDDADKPMFQVLFKAAHESNQTPEQVAATVKTFQQLRTAAMEHQAGEDKKVQTAAEDALRTEWGTEYRRNLNLVHGLLDGAGDGKLKDNVMGGRLADGTPIGSSPAALRMLLGLALIQNPTGVVVPGGEANREAGIDDEIGKIETRMKTDRAGYFKDEKQQARYRSLLEAREKFKGKT